MKSHITRYILCTAIFLITSFASTVVAQDSDLLFQRKYIKKWHSIDGLIASYGRADDIYEKAFLIERLSSFLQDDKAFSFVIKNLRYDDTNAFSTDRTKTWKLRATAIYLLGKNGIKLNDKKRLIILKLARDIFINDKSNRVVVASAIILSRLAQAKGGNYHRLFKKRTIAYLFSDRLFAIKKRPFAKEDNYLVWGLTKASIELGDKNTYFALSEIRKKPFVPYVLSLIDKALALLNR